MARMGDHRGVSDSFPPSAPRADDPELASWIAAEEEAARANPRRVLQIRRAAGVGGAALVLVGAAVWAGWLWNLPALTQVLTQTGSMKRWTALTIALVGIGIALPTLADRPAVRFLGGALCWLAAAIGTSFLIGYATGVELPHDNWFGYAPTPGWTHPGRPAVLSAAGMVPLGLGLALHKLGRIRPAQALSLVPLTLGFLVVVAYMFDLSTPHGGFSLTDMPLPTALAMFVGSLAILGLRADAGYMAIVSSNTAGGRLSRRVLPFAVALPLLVGDLVLSPLQSGRIPAVFALAIVVTAVALLGSVSIWVEASNLRSVDLERAGTAAALRRVTQAEAAQSALAAELAKSSRRLQGSSTRRSTASSASTPPGSSRAGTPPRRGSTAGPRRRPSAGASTSSSPSSTGTGSRSTDPSTGVLSTTRSPAGRPSTWWCARTAPPRRWKPGCGSRRTPGSAATRCSCATSPTGAASPGRCST